MVNSHNKSYDLNIFLSDKTIISEIAQNNLINMFGIIFKRRTPYSKPMYFQEILLHLFSDIHQDPLNLIALAIFESTKSLIPISFL